MIHGDFRADNLFFEADGSVAVGRLPAHRHRSRRLRPGLLRHPEPRPRRRRPARAGPVRPLDRRPWPPPACPRRTLVDLGRLPGRRPVLPRVPGRGVARDGRQRSPPAWTSPPRCSSASTGRWPSSTWPSRSDAWRIRRALAYAGRPQRNPAPSRAVAQLAEQRSPKPQVGGSSPSCPALPLPRNLHVHGDEPTAEAHAPAAGPAGGRRRARGPASAPRPPRPVAPRRPAPRPCSSCGRSAASCARWPGRPGPRSSTTRSSCWSPWSLLTAYVAVLDYGFGEVLLKLFSR